MLLETTGRLREFNRIAVDVGGGGDCFFCAVSHQLYGNPNNHFHVRSLSFHKINTKLFQKTYFALLLSDSNRSLLPTSLNSPPGANFKICLILTERYQSQKSESV